MKTLEGLTLKSVYNKEGGSKVEQTDDGSSVVEELVSFLRADVDLVSEEPQVRDDYWKRVIGAVPRNGKIHRNSSFIRIKNIKTMGIEIYA